MQDMLSQSAEVQVSVCDRDFVTISVFAESRNFETRRQINESKTRFYLGKSFYRFFD